MNYSKIKKKKPDYIFALTVFLLIFFGIIMIASSSVVDSQEHFGNNYHFVGKQVVSLIFGIVIMFLTYSIDYRYWRKISFWALIATIVLLILVFIPGIGKEANGAHRWIGIGNSWFQPSEIVKLTFIIYLASWLEKKNEKIKEFASGFVPFIFFIIIIGFLIMSQPDMGTMLVILGIAIAMYFVAGASLQHFGFGLGALVLAGLVLIWQAPYRLARLQVFLNSSADTQGAAYHINQALLAIGTGGWWGLGFGQSRQKYLYLPQTHTDSIFAIIAEELGFIRTAVFVAVFIFIAMRGFLIAKNAPDTFARLVTVGIIAWVIVQSFINIGAMLNIIPLTGVPLPFISSGGSSLIVLLAAIGIILNISKQTGERI